jgi:aminoglycoside phosphotransferase (APT) family kinase protein
LADLIGDLRAIDTRGRTFAGAGRGGEMQSHDTWMETCCSHSEHLLGVPRLRRIWAASRDLPRGEAAAVMTHGDLIPGNVLVSAGRLTGILDVGGFGPADPSLDLVSAWHLLLAGPRQVLLDRLGCGNLQWQRGRRGLSFKRWDWSGTTVESNPGTSRMDQQS